MADSIKINTPFIKLDAALKLSGIAVTGGIAKILINDGEITVNGEICKMRGKKLVKGDKFGTDKQIFVVE